MLFYDNNLDFKNNRTEMFAECFFVYIKNYKQKDCHKFFEQITDVIEQFLWICLKCIDEKIKFINS